MCVVFNYTGSEFHDVGLEPCELSELEEQQDFHARTILDAGSHYRLVKSYQQGTKEHHHVDTCKQEDRVCTGFFDGLETSATDHAMRSNFRFIKTRRAAERSTDCSLFIISPVSPASKLLK